MRMPFTRDVFIKSHESANRMWVWLLFALATPIRAAFTQRMEMVRDVSLDVMTQTGCGCMVVLYPIHPTPQQDRFLTRLSFAIAKEETRQIMSYTYEQYQFYYAQESRLNAGSCLKTLNIVLISESTETQLEQLSTSHIFTKSIWLLFANVSSGTPFTTTAHLGLNTGVWIVVPKDPRIAEIYEVYHVAEGYPIRHTLLGRWRGRGRLDMTQVPKPLRRRDFEAKVIRAGVLERNTDRKKTKLLGFFPSIWRELEQLLNFRTKISSSVDGGAGFWWAGNWTGLIGMMLRREIDVIITELDYSSARLEAVEHLLPLQKTRTQVYFRLEGYIIDWFSVLKPFSSTIWFTLLLWIVLASLTLYGSITLASRTGLSGGKERKDMTVINCLFFVMQTVCVQGCSWTPRVWATRLIFFFCYLLAAVMLPAYSASLISSLTTKTPNKPFDSLKEMLSTDYKLIVRKNSNRHEYFMNTTDRVLIRIRQKLALPVPNDNLDIDDFPSATIYTCETPKTALFAVESELETHYPYGNAPCHLAKLSNPLGDVYQSMAFTKQSPYRDTFNYFILRMAETGVLDRLEHKYQPRWRRPNETPEIGLNIVDVAEVFAFLGLSLIVSLILFAFEKIPRFQAAPQLLWTD